MNNTDKPNPGLSAFSAHLRQKSNLRNRNNSDDQAQNQEPVSDNDFPNLRKFTERTESNREKNQTQQNTALQYSGNRNSSFFGTSDGYERQNREFTSEMDSGKNTFTVVNKVLVVSIIAVALAIVGVIFTDTNFGATASNIAGVFGSATGSVAGVSTSSNNTSEIISPEKLEEEISQSTDLPADDPQILRVQNPDSFRSRFPVLYRDLQEGDMILIYETKTIVYRPSISKFLAIIPR